MQAQQEHRMLSLNITLQSAKEEVRCSGFVVDFDLVIRMLIPVA